MKIMAKVPSNTIPYRTGERIMACEVTDTFEFIRAVEFFKTEEEARAWTAEHPEFKWKKKEEV